MRIRSFYLPCLQVDWTTEQPCFQGLAQQLSLLYRVQQIGEIDRSVSTSSGHDSTCGSRSDATPGFDSTGFTADHEHAIGEENRRPTFEDAQSESWTIQHVLLPAIRRDYEAPSAHAGNGVVVQVASTETLYKIFERC